MSKGITKIGELQWTVSQVPMRNFHFGLVKMLGKLVKLTSEPFKLHMERHSVGVIGV